MSDILIIDDNATMREGIAQVVKKMGHNPITAAAGEEGLNLFKASPCALTITDLKMEGLDGVEILRAIRKQNEDALVIIITAFGTIETAVNAMKEGAFDFVTKPFSQEMLRVRVQKALEVGTLKHEHARLQQVNRALLDQQSDVYALGEIIGESAKMKSVYDTIRKVANADSSVLVTGESGTGKELVAGAIHQLSTRKNGPFIRVNCGALAETLLESELFGHERGSFTGAIKQKLGRFELAHAGTVFLDEIGDISLTTQVKLLRVLQQHEFERVGGEKTITVDVRVVAATNRDLKERVMASAFREDLYYRLNVVQITLPPLRDRKDDIPLLAEHFIRKLAGRTNRKIEAIALDAMARLSAYSWPGNVRELENVVEQAMIFCDGNVLEARSLPTSVRGDDTAVAGLELPLDDLPLDKVLEDVERQLILRAYERAKGVKTETARLLGIKTSALYYKLEKYGII